MKLNFHFPKFFLLVFFLIFNSTSVLCQEYCLTEDNESEPRTSYTCDDLDDLTLEEVLAMPILNIPVVFHFIAYAPDSNFTCDILDPILNGKRDTSLIYVPTFIYYVLNEMNIRMADQFKHRGTFSDSRVRYNLLDPSGCSSYYFYTSTQNPNTVPIISGALNVLFHRSNGCCMSGSSAPGSNKITHYNAFRNFSINGENDTWSVGRLLNHENGHRFGLKHAFNCDNPCVGVADDGGSLPLNSGVDFIAENECCNACWTYQGTGCCTGCYGCSVKMMGYGSSLQLTPCEHREFWSYHLKSPKVYHDHCNDSTRVDTLIYDTGTKIEWTGQRLINSHVLIKNGTEILISCDVQMGANKKIIIERGARLTLKNATISGLCDFKWTGIIVEGISDTALLNIPGFEAQLANYDAVLDEDKAGTLVVINSSISEAKTAIIMANDKYSWPSYANYYGGLVFTENSKIFDCDRAAAFMMYGQGAIRDKSKFSNSKFEDLQQGITLWANNGVVFDSCQFINCGKRGVLAFDSEISVLNGCSFDTILNGLELFSTYPNPFGHTIGSVSSQANIFLNTDYGIYGTNQGSIKTTKIINNRFTDNDDNAFEDIAIHFDGLSHFEISNNLFNSVFSSQELMATGGMDNIVFRNSIDGNTIGTHYMYDNLGSTFISNCYSNSALSDVELNNSYIFPIQGSLAISASNCFTKNTIPSLHCNSHMNNVKYYKFGSSCFDPIKDSGCSNVTVPSGNTVMPILCSITAPPSPANYSNGCQIPLTTADILTLFNSLDDTISSVQSNTHYTSTEKYDMILGYRKCQATLIYKFIELNLLQTSIDISDMIDSLVTLLDSRSEFIYKMNAFGLLVYSRNHTRARQYLNSVTKSNQDEADFSIVQNINLDYLTNTLNYAPSQNTLDTLYTIGVKIHPYAGYARSLYHQLTDIRIDLEKPEISGVIIPRSTTFEEDLQISSFPNPVNNGIYNVLFKNNKSMSRVAIDVYSTQGSTIHSELTSISENSNVLIRTGDWASNVYYLTVRNVGGIIVYSTKFAVFN